MSQISTNVYVQSLNQIITLFCEKNDKELFVLKDLQSGLFYIPKKNKYCIIQNEKIKNPQLLKNPNESIDLINDISIQIISDKKSSIAITLTPAEIFICSSLAPSTDINKRIHDLGIERLVPLNAEQNKPNAVIIHPNPPNNIEQKVKEVLSQTLHKVNENMLFQLINEIHNNSLPPISSSTTTWTLTNKRTYDTVKALYYLEGSGMKKLIDQTNALKYIFKDLGITNRDEK